MINLNIVVKQVPDVEGVKFDTEKQRIDRSLASAGTNPFDLDNVWLWRSEKEGSG